MREGFFSRRIRDSVLLLLRAHGASLVRVSPSLLFGPECQGFQWPGNSLVSILTGCSVVIHSPSPSATSVHRAAPEFLRAFTHTDARIFGCVGDELQHGVNQNNLLMHATDRWHRFFVEYFKILIWNWLQRSYQHLPGVASSIRQAWSCVLSPPVWDHKFLGTLQASTAPHYIRTSRAPRRSFTCCQWLLDCRWGKKELHQLTWTRQSSVEQVWVTAVRLTL